MKTNILILMLGFALPAFCQVANEPEDSLKDYFGMEVVIYDQDYMNNYNRLKRIIVKVYPYALYAADIIDEIDSNAENIQRRRKQNAFYRDAYKELKEDFKYFLLDLYTSEGVMLMKLIHRETGMTVYDISSKYQSKQKAEVFSVMAKIWDQDLEAKFDPDVRNDKIAEQVIMDIQTGLILFNDEVITIDRLTYKTKQKENREWKRQNHKNIKENEKTVSKRRRKLSVRKKNRFVNPFVFILKIKVILIF